MVQQLGFCHTIMLHTFLNLTFAFFFFCILLTLLSSNKNLKCTAWNTAKISYFNNNVERKNNYQQSQEKRRWAFYGHFVKSHHYALLHPGTLPEKEDLLSDYRAPCMSATIPQQETSFLIHKGRSTNMIRRSPAIQGGALCKGWTEATTQAFVSAIHSVVGRNPILSGHVYDKNRNIFETGELWIDSGAYTPDKHQFVNYIDAPPDTPDFDKMNSTETLDYCVAVLMPLLNNGGSELTEKQIKDKLPLFATSIMVLPNNYAFYSVKVSHAVGDGVTFFHIMQEISMLMNGRHHQNKNNFSIPSLEWSNPMKPTHEFYPDAFSPGDVEKSYGLPFLCGLLKNFPTLASRSQNILLLCKKKVSQKKREYRFNGTEPSKCSHPISSNDIITAALCEANESSDIFVFTENIRGLKEGIPQNASGNFFWEVPVSRVACAANPLQVRMSVANGGYYPTDELPLQPFLCGRVGRLTSLATITHTISYPGTETICQIPFISFLQEIPLDVAVIFRYNNLYWGVLHNFAQFRLTGLLREFVV